MSHQHDHKHEGPDCCGHDHHDHAAEAKAPDHKHDDCCGHEHHDHPAGEKDPVHKHGGHEGCGHDHVHDEHCAHDHTDDGEDAEWTRRFFIALQAVVLIMMGGVLCYFVASGRIDGKNPDSPYVTGWFKTLALCGGLGIMVMGVFNWLMRGKEAACGHDHSADDGCDHDHGSEAPAPHHHHEGSVMGRAMTLLVLSGSVAAAAMLTPDQFSSRYLQHKAEAYRGDSGSQQRMAAANPALAAARAAEPANGVGLTLAKIEEYVKRTKDGNFPLSVVNLHYMSGDPEYADVMEGQMIETTGQVVKDQVNPGPGHLRVVTMMVTCCAADARPYSIPVVFEGPAPDHVEMGWYEITGKLEFTRERGMKMALVRAKDMKATIRPADQRPGM